MKDKPRCNGLWTEARFNSFIKSALRGATRRWAPITTVRQEARVERGKYRCVGYNRRSHVVPSSLPPKKGNKRRIKNALVDHINPIVDPAKGFESWDIIIERMFVEEEGLQVMCHVCHQLKCNDEKEIAKKRKLNEQEQSRLYEEFSCQCYGKPTTHT